MDVLDNNFLKKLFFLIKNSIQHKKIFIFANFIKLLMMYNFNFTSFQGINVFATSKLTNFFENKNEFHLEELFEQEGIIENIKISGQTASNL